MYISVNSVFDACPVRCRFGYLIGVAKNKSVLWLKELRLQFCIASVMPVLIGSALAYKQIGNINYTLAVLALFATVAFQIASNISNDYFDNRSKNDILNENKTPFSGGSGLLQKGLITPKGTLIAALLFFTIGAILGIGILIITKSFFVFALGLAGLLGGFFYTAPPLKLGYRTAGEIAIALLFGILPVYGAYYIQTEVWDLVPLLPAIVVAVLIFLVIFANEFPDFEADKAVNKRTLVVTLGIKKAAFLYKAALVILYILTNICGVVNKIERHLAFLLLIMPFIILGIQCFRMANAEKLSQKGNADLSKATIILHIIGGIALFIAILLSKSV